MITQTQYPIITLYIIHIFRYESRGIGCYMFKIDDDTVIGYMNLIAFFDFHQIWILNYSAKLVRLLHHLN